MSHDLDPTHQEVAKTAWEKIHESIMRCRENTVQRVGKQIIGAASLLDVLEPKEKEDEWQDLPTQQS